jgi:hypothetical protein
VTKEIVPQYVGCFTPELIEFYKCFLKIEPTLPLKSPILKYRTDFEDFPFRRGFEVKAE